MINHAGSWMVRPTLPYFTLMWLWWMMECGVVTIVHSYRCCMVPSKNQPLFQKVPSECGIWSFWVLTVGAVLKSPTGCLNRRVARRQDDRACLKTNTWSHTLQVWHGSIIIIIDHTWTSRGFPWKEGSNFKCDFSLSCKTQNKTPPKTKSTAFQTTERALSVISHLQSPQCSPKDLPPKWCNTHESSLAEKYWSVHSRVIRFDWIQWILRTHQSSNLCNSMEMTRVESLTHSFTRNHARTVPKPTA